MKTKSIETDCTVTFLFNKQVSEEKMHKRVESIFRSLQKSIGSDEGEWDVCVDSQYDEDGYHIVASVSFAEIVINKLKTKIKQTLRKIEKKSPSVKFIEVAVGCDSEAPLFVTM